MFAWVLITDLKTVTQCPPDDLRRALGWWSCNAYPITTACQSAVGEYSCDDILTDSKSGVKIAVVSNRTFKCAGVEFHLTPLNEHSRRLGLPVAHPVSSANFKLCIFF